MHIAMNIEVSLLDKQNLVEEKEVEYILEVHVKDHHGKVQVLLLLRRYTHTQPGGLGVQGSFLFRHGVKLKVALYILTGHE